MIEYRKGNILLADAEALVNTVNCVGIMGRGIALQFKNAFPENFKEYAKACKNEEVQPGRMLVHRTGSLTNPRFIINFPTKRHWKGKSRMEDIEAGLLDLETTIQEYGIQSIAIPPLGSGLGGLNWDEVRPRIETMAARLSEVRVFVYEPLSDNEKPSPASDKEPPNMTTSRALLILAMDRYRRAVLDPYVTLLEVHKLLYLLQEAGQDLRLKFAKAPYGPYAANVRHVLNAIEGHYVAGYDGEADSPDKPLSIIPGAVEEAVERLSNQSEIQERLQRLFELVEGWETPHGLELLATVHWVAKHEDACDSESALKQTYAWGDRKRKFSERQIELAYSLLKSQKWVN